MRASPTDARRRLPGLAAAGLVVSLLAFPAGAGSRLRLEAPRLAVERAGAGHLDLDLALPRVVFRPAEDSSASRVEILSAAIGLRDVPGEGSSASATLQATLERAPGADAWSGDAILELTEGRVAVSFVEATAPARVAGGVSVGEGGFAVRGAELQAAGLTIERVAGTEVEARFDFDFADLAFDVDALRFTWFDGAWQAAGRVSLEEESFAASVKATETDLERLALAVLGARDENQGALVVDARVQGDWSDRDRWLDTLEGEGSFAVVGGTFPSFALFSAVWSALFERIPGVKALDLDPGAASPTRLEEITYPFSLANSRLTTEELRVETDDHRGGGRGSLGLDGSLEFEVVVEFTAQGRRKVFSMTRLPGSREVIPIPPIPIEISGSLADPEFEADASVVSGRTLLGLAGQLRGASGALGNALAGAAKGSLELLGEAGDKIRSDGNAEE